MKIGAYETNQVYCCDALELLRGLPDGSVDLVVTSPPYDNLRTYNGYSFEFEPIAHESYRVLKQGGVQVWVVGDSVVNGSETLVSFRQALFFKEHVGFRVHDTMIYEKDGAPFPESNRYLQQWEFMFVLSKGAPAVHNLLQERTLYGGSASNSTRSTDGSVAKIRYATNKPTHALGNIWRLVNGYMKTTKDTYAFDHPAMFPEKLAERHILTWSNSGDLVLDYFGGSGTTAKMARNNGRRWLTCDISAEYCELIRRRLDAPYTPNMFNALAEALP
jgi:DNA modification methylase